MCFCYTQKFDLLLPSMAPISNLLSFWASFLFPDPVTNNFILSERNSGCHSSSFPARPDDQCWPADIVLLEGQLPSPEQSTLLWGGCNHITKETQRTGWREPNGNCTHNGVCYNGMKKPKIRKHDSFRMGSYNVMLFAPEGTLYLPRLFTTLTSLDEAEKDSPEQKGSQYLCV